MNVANPLWTRRRLLIPLFLAVLLVLGSTGIMAAPAAGVSRGAVVPEALLTAQGTPAAGTPVVIRAPAASPATHPKGEQTLPIAGPISGPTTLDPALASDVDTAFLVRQVFRGLTRLDNHLQPQPELAESITISADGLTYTFDLQPHATFQDGHPVTAADVVFSLTRALEPATAGGDASQLAGPTFLMDIAGAADVVAGRTTTLAGVQAIDPHTVRIRLSAPRATFLMKLAAAPASIVERADVQRGSDWWRDPAGSGPFEITAWTPNKQMTLKRYANFFAGAPTLHEIDIALGPSAQQPFNLYQAGTIDIATATPDVIDRITDPASAYKSQVVTTPLFAVDYIAFSPNAAPMDDPHIRRAVQLAFPRQKVADVSFEGHVRPAAGLIPNGMLGRDWPVQWPAYNLAAAKQEIAASKYKTAANVPPLRIYGASVEASESLRDVLEQDLGLKVEVISVDWNDFLTGLGRREFPAYELYWLADYPDPEDLLETLFGSSSPANYIGYHNPVFDALMQRAETDDNPAQRDALLARAQQLLVDDGVIMPIYNDVSYTLVRPNVKGLTVTPLGIMDFDNVWLEH